MADDVHLYKKGLIYVDDCNVADINVTSNNLVAFLVTSKVTSIMGML